MAQWGIGKVMCATATSIFVQAATAQCVGCSTGTPINSQYQPNALGTSEVVRNQDLTATPPVLSVVSLNGYAIKIADPTVMVIRADDAEECYPGSQFARPFYFVTGTCDDFATGNFIILRSRDLKEWRFHMMAFDDRNRIGNDNEPPADTSVPCGDTPDFSGPVGGPTWPRSNAGAMRFGAYQDSSGVWHSTRSLVSMWAPHLYEDGGNVYLSFTAVERPDTTAPIAGCGDPQNQPVNRQTLFVSTMTKCAFMRPVINNCPKFSEPIRYGYSAGNVPLAGEGALDGGTATRRIATSGKIGVPQVVQNGCLYTFANNANATTWVDPPGSTWMSLDGFVYRDALDSNRRWMLYTWRSWAGTNAQDGTYSGNNCSAYPMFTNTLMDAGILRAGPLHLAYRFSRFVDAANGINMNPPRSCVNDPVENEPCTSPPNTTVCPGTPTADGRLFNGMSSGGASRLGRFFSLNKCGSRYAVAEGPAAFSRNGATYLLYSRNGFDSPAYAIMYRARFGSLAQLGLDFSSTSNLDAVRDLPEYRLVSAVPDRRGIPGGRSMGHGEVFTPDDQRYYLVYHIKSAGSIARYVAFKELTFRAPLTAGAVVTGGEESSSSSNTIPGQTEPDEIVGIEDNELGDATDAELFMIPRECLADHDRDGVVGTEDVFTFLNDWFAQSFAADIDDSNSVEVNDIFTFLNTWFTGCDWY